MCVRRTAFFLGAAASREMLTLEHAVAWGFLQADFSHLMASQMASQRSSRSASTLNSFGRKIDTAACLRASACAQAPGTIAVSTRQSRVARPTRPSLRLCCVLRAARRCAFFSELDILAWGTHTSNRHTVRVCTNRRWHSRKRTLSRIAPITTVKKRCRTGRGALQILYTTVPSHGSGRLAPALHCLGNTIDAKEVLASCAAAPFLFPS